MTLQYAEEVTQRLSKLFSGTYKHISTGFVPVDGTEGKMAIYMRKTDERDPLLSWDGGKDMEYSLHLSRATMIITDIGIALRTDDEKLVEGMIVMLMAYCGTKNR